MNSIAATPIIPERLRQRVLPHHEAWRCQGGVRWRVFVRRLWRTSHFRAGIVCG